jgi:DNA mismatch endonuclease, patch repair protein
MAAIKSKDTAAEIRIRSILHRAGYRFRKNYARLPGTPDIYLPRWQCVIMINGCFWHRHMGCRYATTPKNNTEFWQQKFRANVERDIRKLHALQNLGISVIILWGCEINSHSDRELLSRLDTEIRQNSADQSALLASL